MALHFSDKWIWDPWFAHANGDWHVFYLQAPKTITNADERHWHTSIGHAVSQDLIHWTILPDALSPQADDPQAWDSYTTWTGSILHHQGRWFLFYTGTSRAEGGRVQRIGFANSKDLLHWQKFEANPVLTGDAAPYEQFDPKSWPEQAWRDPWVFQEAEAGGFHVLITARVGKGPIDGRGVIGHAQSPDLLDWEILPPITEPGNFSQMEVPQLFSNAAAHYLLFSTVSRTFSQALLNEEPDQAMSGVYYLRAAAPLGPFASTTRRPLIGTHDERYYAGKLIEQVAGRLVYLPALYKDHDGNFIGALADPLEVIVTDNGELRVNMPPPVDSEIA